MKEKCHYMKKGASSNEREVSLYKSGSLNEREVSLNKIEECHYMKQVSFVNFEW